MRWVGFGERQTNILPLYIAGSIDDFEASGDMAEGWATSYSTSKNVSFFVDLPHFHI